ncbi:MAG: chloride channel protein [Polyangiaceae bacterium]|nr:chloride channel protein [Polyangiaceae bacterium]
MLIHFRDQGRLLRVVLLWAVLGAFLGAIVGSCAAAFLFALQWVGISRESFLPWIILFLGPAGVLVTWLYQRYGQRSDRGNNLIIEELHEPRQILPFRMAVLVVGGTLVSHLFGGSAGREGTAVQMGAVIADQFTRPFRLDGEGRKVIIAAGVAAGFSALFGTPLAGAVFALEVFVIGRMLYYALLPALFTSLCADWMCRFWDAPHTHYEIGAIPSFGPIGFSWAILAGVAFGFCALLFSVSVHHLGYWMKRKIRWPLVRPVVGALAVGGLFLIFGPTYLGLGIPTIVASFHESLPAESFIIKLIFTVVTLAAGFKGGEVTPLFFIGATLGNLLSLFIPDLPMGLLAGMGFVAVFAGAANTPIACILMGVELFGGDCLSYVAVACVTAYLISGHTGIYGSQRVQAAKSPTLAEHEGRELADLSFL